MYVEPSSSAVAVANAATVAVAEDTFGDAGG